ncbi:hypothetical protein WMO40_16975 [Bacillaceae bacterium CLA-AA-H227]|uniref:Uncharacterized protein n=1 Tax=Robertmurraya yapensis (ex Hitch et al 2024) TaxID=3133160 RepID=A0ACC6SET5_9BACI
MTVNRSSVLSVDYFESYFRLVMTSRNFVLEEAKEYMISNFFQGDVMLYEEDSYHSFTDAYLRLKKIF